MKIQLIQAINVDSKAENWYWKNNYPNMSISGVSGIASPSSKMQSHGGNTPSAVLPNDDGLPGASAEPTQVCALIVTIYTNIPD